MTPTTIATTTTTTTGDWMYSMVVAECVDQKIQKGKN